MRKRNCALALGLVGIGLGLLGAAALDAPAPSPARLAIFTLAAFAHACEFAFVVYAVFATIAAFRYWRLPIPAEPTAPPPGPIDPIPAAVIYLCCGDLDEEALRSLSRLRYPGPLIRIVHDDSTDSLDQERVDAAVAAVAVETGSHWRVLRRADHGGGKPGALNYVLRETAGEHEVFLLADNDSAADDSDLLTRIVPQFGDASVAGVQLRNRSLRSARDGNFAADLSFAVDMFDAFMVGLFAWLWPPFIGHNAMLRTRDVIAAGSFTPGVFADDIDLTARLTRAGKRIVYRRDLVMYERHPDNYRAFCQRSRKWAHGCAQVLRLHWLSFLTDRRVSMRAKLGFLLFTGFYLTQAAMLGYMVLVLLVLPWLLGSSWVATWWALLIATSVPVATFLPVVVYLLKEGRHRPFRRTLLACALTYGSMDLWTVAGLATGMRKKPRPWIPTNLVKAEGREWLDWAHFGAGLAFLLVPLVLQPQLLLFPLTWIFAGKYLFVPSVAAHYVSERARPREIPETAKAERTALARIWALCLLFPGLVALPAPTRADTTPNVPGVEVHGDEIRVEGRPFLVRGVHYSPWRPGTGPGRGFDYPSDAELSEDLGLIRQLHANTILVYDAPRRLLDLAAQRGLRVIYSFNILWWQLASEEGEPAQEIGASIASRVRELADHPALLAWMVGNEVPGWVVDRLGGDAVAASLSGFRNRIRSAGSQLPVCHGNWPLTRTFDLDREMDLVCYNVYPFYPTEVAAAGYERFLSEEVMPRANERPVVVTEFGINTLEASEPAQGMILQRCWRDLLAAGAQGGVVFAFADEWWKNYDGPIAPPDWWRRRDEPDDYRSHDRDPEEHYGLVTDERVPKPAFHAVQQMFRGSEEGSVRVLLRRVLPWAVGPGALAMVVLAIWLPLRARRRARTSSGRRARAAAFLATGLVILGSPDARAQADKVTVELLGETAGDSFGKAVAGGGDVDGDGLADVAVGAPFADPVSTAEGAVYVFLGDPTFFSTSPRNAGMADHVLSGSDPDCQFGISVARLTDLDQDGFADVAVGARFSDLAAQDAGAALVHFGGPGIDIDPPLALLGEAADDWFGNSVASAGDVNGDGFPDLIVGAPYNDANATAAGRAYVFLGGGPMNAGSDVVLEGAAQVHSHFGWSVSGAGDVNQDGFDDVIVGARLHGTGPLGAAGRAYLFFGGGPMDAVADVILEGEAKNDWFGESVAGAGDVDGDGFDDVVVGAVFADPPSGSAAGKAYVFFGGNPPDTVPDLVIEGPHADAQLGNAVGGGGDVDGDGFDDVVVGVHFAAGPAAERAVGETWVVFGGTTPNALPDLVLQGDAMDDQLGESVALGDAPDGSAAAGMLAGAHFADDLGDAAGKAVVLPEPEQTTLLALGVLGLAALLRIRRIGESGMDGTARPH